MSGEPGGACPVCGGAVSAYRHDWLWRCQACGVLRSTFAIDIADTPDEVHVNEAMRETGLATLRHRNNARLLETLARLRPAPARLLDVGCGPGFLLSQALEAGFEASGVEPDANVVAAASARGAPVRHGYFPDALRPGELFDIIVFNDVLEHIPDLTSALAASAAHLAPDGILCLNCPDRRGFLFQAAAVLDRLGVHGAYDRLWQRGLPSPHVWYFTPENLAQAARPVGFAPVAEVRLDTVELKGLWERIRCVREESLALSAAAFAFSVATYPVAQVAPSDAVACFFRKGPGAAGPP